MKSPRSSFPSTDDGTNVAMERLAAARNSVFNQSNRFLVAGMIFAVFYGVKAAGLRLDIVILDNKVFELPYGLFVFCVLGAGSFLIAQTRFMDAHAIDRRMFQLSKENHPQNPKEYLQTFPAEASWLRLSKEQFFSDSEKSSSKLNLLVNLAGLALMGLYLLPAISCLHFLLNWPSLAGEQVMAFQWWIVATALTLDVLFLFLVAKTHQS